MSSPLTKVYYKVDTTDVKADIKGVAFHYFYKWLQTFDETESLKSIETRIIKGYEDQSLKQNSFSMCVSFYNHDHANSFRRKMSYSDLDENTKAVAFWYGIRPAHEVIVRDAPDKSTRRTIFEKYERYGDIGRVTPCKSDPSVFWVSFISSRGAKNAFTAEPENVSLVTRSAGHAKISTTSM